MGTPPSRPPARSACPRCGKKKFDWSRCPDCDDNPVPKGWERFREAGGSQQLGKWEYRFAKGGATLGLAAFLCVFAGLQWAITLCLLAYLPGIVRGIRWFRTDLSKEGQGALLWLAAFSLLMACTILSLIGGPPAPSPKEERERLEAERKAGIWADARHRQAAWERERQRLRSHLSPTEIAELVDEQDRWDAIERAGRAGRRLGEALRNR